MWILQAILLAMSLCADCLAVSTCSSVTLKEVSWRKVLPIALVFGFVQAGLMALGWLCGDIFIGYVDKIANLIGFLLLLYVGGSMFAEGLGSRGEEARDLNGIKNVIVGAVATSIDALAVGISLCMSRPSAKVMAADLASVFIVTILSVTAGMFWGHKIGSRFGRVAEIVGGVVLVVIGLNVLFGWI